jgi:hypothetical protein
MAVGMAVTACLLLSPWTPLASAEQAAFFKLSMAADRAGYLLGEEIFVHLTVANPTRKTLAYVQKGESSAPLGSFVEHVDFTLTKDGETFRPVEAIETNAGPWGASSSFTPPVIPLPPGREVRTRIPLRPMYGLFPPGEYMLRARLSQPSSDRGQTRGETVSNEVRFRVADWQAHSYLEKTRVRERGDETHPWKTVARLVRTTQQGLLISWETGFADEARLRLRTIRLPVEFELSTAFWGIDDKTCHIVYPGEKPSTYELLVVDPSKSTVTRATLTKSPRVLANNSWIVPVVAIALLTGALATRLRKRHRRP